MERTEQNTISVRIKNNKYYEARISLKIGGGKSTRFQNGGKNQEEAILKLLEKVELFIITITNSGSMTFKINANLPNLLIKSINKPINVKFKSCINFYDLSNLIFQEDLPSCIL